MKLYRLLSILILASFSFFISGCSNNNSLSDAQKTEVKSIVDQEIHDYLLANPQILNQMVRELQAQQQQQAQQKAVGAIKQNATQLVNDPVSPVVGDKNGAVTFIEFFDYQCMYCAKMYPIVKQVLAANPNVRVVFKEFPIFGAASQYAAAAALAANQQGKYIQMHNALFDSGYIEGKMTDAKVDAIAKKVGLNMVQLKKDMASSAIQNELKANMVLAQQMGIQGTPAFIIVPTNLNSTTDVSKIGFIPSVASSNDLQQTINAAK